MDNSFPPIPPALITRLEESFPDKRPSLNESDREVWFKTGQASVVRFLRDHLRLQEQDALEGSNKVGGGNSTTTTTHTT